MTYSGIDFSSFLFYPSAAIGYKPHWPVKKSRAVLTGLWKVCGRLKTKDNDRHPERRPERRSPCVAEHENCRMNCRTGCRANYPTPDPTACPTVILPAVSRSRGFYLIPGDTQKRCGVVLISMLSCHVRVNVAIQITVTLWCQCG
jgi:hypothetical protein